LQIIALDIESFFSQDFTLSKMTTESYIRDERFEVHGAAIKWSRDTPAKWTRDLHLLKDAVDWNDTAIIAHHAHFDGSILNHIYGIKPRIWLDTLSMARLLLGNHLSVSLDSVRKQFGLPAKQTPYELFKGKHWHDLDPGTQRLIAEGCEDEVESIWTLFRKLAEHFPLSEYPVVDMTVRMFTEPTLRGDIDLLGKIWRDENERKLDLVVALGVSDSDLQSADTFAKLLRAEGIEPALKQGKNGPIYAFAKTDDFMKELLDHDDPRVSGLARARLGIKSTAIQSRCESLGWMAQRGPLCVYLRYCGAATTRWSGGDSSNFQNFKRGHSLRSSILAPSDRDLAVIDSSQIECRLLNWLAGQWDVVAKFRNKEDPYAELASHFYGEPIYKPADDDPRKEELTAKRGAGKQGELMCGYGCGGAKFTRMAAMGLYGPPITISEAEGDRRVKIYRDTHGAICGPNGYWRAAEQVLAALAHGDTLQWGPMRVQNHRLYTPAGLPLIYDTLEWVAEGDERGWRLKTRQGWTRIWGSKLVQHVCEALAREIVAVAMVKIAQAGYRLVGMSHDEIWILISKGDQAAFDFCLETMKVSPPWAPDLPLDAEGSFGARYAK
jgi:DNA polymerase